MLIDLSHWNSSILKPGEQLKCVGLQPNSECDGQVAKNNILVHFVDKHHGMAEKPRFAIHDIAYTTTHVKNKHKAIFVAY